jgi:2-polyprenyl-3-methyl-5-hydroxy-6-metoxy-1,4-benzoquinol methylase
MSSSPAQASPAPALRPGLNPALDDSLPWQELAEQYNFRHPTDRSDIFARLLREELAELPRPTKVLDIGCGRGIELNVGLTRSIRPLAGEFWGIEPDSSIVPEQGLFDNYQNALMETAKLPENYFDLAYSFMVMEHVKEPRPFMQAVGRCLKPGGSYVFGTINGAHYFARMAGMLRRLKLDELILRVVRGKGTVEAYHYPVFYRINTPRAISSLAEELGFEEPEFLFLEQSGPDEYLRGPLRPLLRVMQWKRDRFRDPASLLVLFCRLTKKGVPGERAHRARAQKKHKAGKHTPA